MNRKVDVSITYCTACNFRGRAAWIAQELLAEHEHEIASLSLVPGHGGMFEVRFDGELAFSNKEAGRFPDPRELKDALRDKLGLPPKEHHGN